MKILILSEERDRTCDIVCDYLSAMQCQFIRINSESSYQFIIEINGNSTGMSISLATEKDCVDFNEINTVWFRRGQLYLGSPKLNNDLLLGINYHIENEGNTLKDYIYEVMSNNCHINNPKIYNYNKISALAAAVKVGFKIPNTLISRSGASIQKFITSNKNCITKSIQDMADIMCDNFYSTVGKISRVGIEDITETSYWYSLFQQEISKKYELRIFYFMGRMYAMAIFSQMNPKSSLDFREVDVNGKHPNRMVPFNLPNDIKQKIRNLMKNIKLESGSIDIIVTSDNEYYFLEVNPVGQFNFVSEICNYHIEKNIAFFLAHER